MRRRSNAYLIGTGAWIARGSHKSNCILPVRFDSGTAVEANCRTGRRRTASVNEMDSSRWKVGAWPFLTGRPAWSWSVMIIMLNLQNLHRWNCQKKCDAWIPVELQPRRYRIAGQNHDFERLSVHKPSRLRFHQHKVNKARRNGNALLTEDRDYHQEMSITDFTPISMYVWWQNLLSLSGFEI